LEDRRRLVKLDALPIFSGILPFNELLDKSKVEIFLKENRLLGMLPYSALRPSSKPFISDKFPNAEGIVPFRQSPLLYRLNKINFDYQL
jgi:hypothetical protein